MIVLEVPILVRRLEGAGWSVETVGAPRRAENDPIRLSHEGPILEHAKARLAKDIERVVLKHGAAHVRDWLVRPAARLERPELVLEVRDAANRKSHVRGRFAALSYEAPAGLGGRVVVMARVPAVVAHVPEGADLGEVLGGALERQFAGDPEGLEAAAEGGRREWLHELRVEIDRAALCDKKGAAEEEVDGLGAIFGARRKRSGKRSVEELERAETLREVGIDLVGEARDGLLPRAIGRDRIVDDVVRALTGGETRAVLLVGEPGTGKTAIVHEVAHRLLARQGQLGLRRNQGTVFGLSAAHLIAGMRYVGQWEERCLDLAEEAIQLEAVLHADSLPELMAAGRVRAGDRTSIASLWKPFVESGRLAIVAEATPEGLRRCEEDDRSVVELFRVVRVREPAPSEALTLAISAAREIESRRPGVSFAPKTIPAAIEALRRFVPYEAFPGKAIRLLDRLAERARPGYPAEPVHATLAFSSTFGLTNEVIDDRYSVQIEHLRDVMSWFVKGQPEANQALAEISVALKAGLHDPEKPLAALLFAGPTGVGKTESAKALAQHLYGSADRLIRFDLNEASDPGAAERLVGSAWQPEGELTRAIRERPFAVVLLDEVEKAHPSVHDLLLQLLGEGRVTDALGRTADARSCVFILTSNLGVEKAGRALGLAGREDRKDDGANAAAARYVAAIEDFFRPELVNRLDRIVPFRQLPRDVLRQIAARESAALLQREGVARRPVFLETDDRLLDRAVDEVAGSDLGARPLRRAVERRLAVPLAAALARRPIQEAIIVGLRDEGPEQPARVEITPIAGMGPIEPGPRAADLVAPEEGSYGERAAALADRLRALEDAPERKAIARAVFDAVQRRAAGEDIDEAALDRLDRIEREIEDARRFVASLAEGPQRGALVEHERWEYPPARRFLSFGSPGARERIVDLEWTKTPPPFEARLRAASLRVARLERLIPAALEAPERAVLRFRSLGETGVWWGACLAVLYDVFFAALGATVRRLGDDAIEIVFPRAREWLAGETGVHEMRAPGDGFAPAICRVSLEGGQPPSAESNGARVVRKYVRGKFIHDMDLACSAPIERRIVHDDDDEPEAYASAFAELLTP